MKLIMENWRKFTNEAYKRSQETLPGGRPKYTGKGTGKTSEYISAEDIRSSFLVKLEKVIMNPSRWLNTLPQWASGQELKTHDGVEIEKGQSRTVTPKTKADIQILIDDLENLKQRPRVERTPVVDMLAMAQDNLKGSGIDGEASLGPISSEEIEAWEEAVLRRSGMVGTMPDAPSGETASRIGKQAGWSAEDLLAKMRSLK